MIVDMNLFLHNVQVALANQQYQHAQFLLEYAMRLTKDQVSSPALSLENVGIGLHRGRVRENNEDCLLALNATLPGAQRFGLYIVCDGIGGHAHGQEAAHLAIQTILEYVFPLLKDNTILLNWEHLLVESIQQANSAIYLQNKLMRRHVAKSDSDDSSQRGSMGTTVTAAILFNEKLYVANVGDSRAYLYDQSLKKITKDHSVVAAYLAQGILKEEDIYTHPKRHQIIRSLGNHERIEVDTFVVPLRGSEILLLCSDGLWEMTRDRYIARIISASWSHPPSLANRLVQLANDGGGEDNIGCIVVRLPQKADVSSIDTLVDPTSAFTKLVMALT